MTYYRLISMMIAGAAVALSQTPAPPAVAAPTPAAAPRPYRVAAPDAILAQTPAPQAVPAPPASVAAPAPAAPRPYRVAVPDTIITPEIEAQIEAARDKVETLRDFKFDSETIREQ